MMPMAPASAEPTDAAQADGCKASEKKKKKSTKPKPRMRLLCERVMYSVGSGRHFASEFADVVAEAGVSLRLANDPDAPNAIEVDSAHGPPRARGRIRFPRDQRMAPLLRKRRSSFARLAALAERRKGSLPRQTSMGCWKGLRSSAMFTQMSRLWPVEAARRVPLRKLLLEAAGYMPHKAQPQPASIQRYQSKQ